MTPFLHDPTANGAYDVRLRAFDGRFQVVQTGIQVIVGTGAPEPMVLLMWGGLIMCASLLSVRAVRFASAIYVTACGNFDRSALPKLRRGFFLDSRKELSFL